ncbi:MAG: hypothetical protein ACU84Q_07315 [Gammaproteobacteria bacterium]
MASEISQASSLSLFTHLKKWASNLRRANIERKSESMATLQAVTPAVRKTAVFCPKLKRRGERNEENEEELSLSWTNLGFRLDELNLGSLAKQCQISGKDWSDPEHYSADILATADVSLDAIKKFAFSLLQEIKETA